MNPQTDNKKTSNSATYTSENQSSQRTREEQMRKRISRNIRNGLRMRREHEEEMEEERIYQMERDYYESIDDKSRVVPEKQIPPNETHEERERRLDEEHDRRHFVNILVADGFNDDEADAIMDYYYSLKKEGKPYNDEWLNNRGIYIP